MNLLKKCITFCIIVLLNVQVVVADENSKTETNSVIDSLERLISTIDKSEKVKLLCDLCWEYRFISTDKALSYGEQALQLAIISGDSAGIAQAYNDAGIIYMSTGNYDKAVKYFSTALQIRKLLNNEKGQLALYNKLGIIFQQKGDLEKALANQLQALKIAEKLNHEPYMAFCLNNIAIIHFNINNFEKSIEYHKKALALRTKIGDANGIAASYCNMGNVYNKKDNNKLALEYYNKALDVFIELDDKQSLALQLSNIGVVQLKQGRYSDALATQKRALKIRESLGEQKFISSSLLKIGNVYIAMRKAKEALPFIKRGLSIAKNINVSSEISEGYIEMSKIYMLKQNSDSSFYYLDKYLNFKDSVLQANSEKQLVDAQEKYEVEKKDFAITLLESKQQLTSSELRRKATQVWLLISILLSILGAGFTYSYRYRQKQKEQKIRRTQKQQEQMLHAVIESQEREREKVARELHDGIGQTLAAVKMSYELLNENNNEIQNKQNYVENLSHLDEVCNEIRIISHQMLPKILVEVGLDKALKLLIEQQFTTDDLICRSTIDVVSEKRLPKDVELAYYRIIQELFNNIIKHANASVINIKLNITINECSLIVKDNGVGFDINVHNRGIGLSNIYSRAKQIGAHVEFKSDEGRGTLFKMHWAK